MQVYVCVFFFIVTSVTLVTRISAPHMYARTYGHTGVHARRHNPYENTVTPVTAMNNGQKTCNMPCFAVTDCV